MGAKRKEGGPTKAKLTPSRHGVLREATANVAGVWAPVTGGDFRMARRLAADGFGSFNEASRLFAINDAGRAAAKEGA